MALAAIRHSINTADPFYRNEKDFYDEAKPLYESMVHSYYKALLDSPFLEEIRNRYGEQLIRLATKNIRVFDPSIIEEMQEENRLASQYTRTLAQARIQFMGREHKLSGLFPYEISPDRETRRKAFQARFGFFEKNAPDIEQLFDRLVHLRHSMAVKLGYNNYILYAYDRLGRTDFTPEMAARYRDMILTYIVPITLEIRERQTRKLNVSELQYYDLAIYYPDGNARLDRTPGDVIRYARKMYSELSPETEQFFSYLADRELMDLVSKKDKAEGGYCEYLPNFKAPFIFSNFNGTSADIDVFTHEAGHAFQIYTSRNMEVPEYYYPTYEACEIHSMSMEYFTYPWMHLFFGDDTEKYLFTHLAASINFLPYGVAIDHFQHLVYENPDMTPAQRNETWRQLEMQYLPFRKYEGNIFLERGGFWQKQSHIFNNPFYYLDYTLAGVCALQFWIKDQEDHQKAWNDYVNLCKLGGSRSFLELVEAAGLESPFHPDTIPKVAEYINDWLKTQEY